jgi:D-alanyl-D-alanine carboxypeptidase (penicillin-binding protein 5/6)
VEIRSICEDLCANVLIGFLCVSVALCEKGLEMKKNMAPWFVGFFVAGIGLFGYLKTSGQPPDGYLPKLLRKNLCPACDVIVGNLKDGIEAGMGVNISTGEIFWEKDAEKTCRIASLTKLMVVLIVMESVKRGEMELDELVTVSGESSRMGGSQVYLKEGEEFPLSELMKAMMIASANDAAYLVGEYTGGTKEEFVKTMNRKASMMGLDRTYFSNPTGLPASPGDWENVSTCMDIAYLAMRVIEFPEVMEWASTEFDLFRDGEFELRTWNSLLKKYDYIDGLKTGYYRKAGWNIVATSLGEEPRVMAIVLGAKSRRARDGVARALIEYVLFDAEEESHD